MAERDDNFSAFLAKTLNAMGYNWQLVQQRRDCHKQSEHVHNSGYLSKFGMSVIIVGSRREGVCAPMESDGDAMMVFHEVVCAEQVSSFERQANLTILELDVNEAPPGYASVSIARHGGRFAFDHMGQDEATAWMYNFFESSLCTSYSGKSCVSSDKIIDIVSNIMKIGLLNCSYNFPNSILTKSLSLSPRTGPSLPMFSDNNVCQGSVDNVLAITCHCPSILERFRNRKRKHGWPPGHIMEEISQLEAHVVPVGYKRSPNHFMEWRICFTKAELRLIECLTEPQIHVFVLLKIFAKDVLVKVWDALTSYIMKNLILWMAELVPGNKFRTDTIVDRFLDCLAFLQRCVKTGHLPNYMIPERNLLSHDTFIPKRRKLLSFLDDCLQEKGSCLMKSPKLKDALLNMYKDPSKTVKDGLDRDQSEMVVMSYWARVGPELSIATTPQDLVRLTLNGYMSDITRLFFERFTPVEILSDPVGSIRQFIQTMVSHLK